jgi:hypothetical protein
MLSELAAQFTAVLGKQLQKCTLIFDNPNALRKTTDLGTPTAAFAIVPAMLIRLCWSTLAGMVEIVSARPHHKTSDDQLVAWATAAQKVGLPCSFTACCKRGLNLGLCCLSTSGLQAGLSRPRSVRDL